MSGIEHARCGYSELAPGCDDWECLVHRIDVSFARGWDCSHLQARLDAGLTSAVDDVLVRFVEGSAPHVIDVRKP